MTKYLCFSLSLMMFFTLEACKKNSLQSSSLTDVDGTKYVVNESLGRSLASSALRGNQGYSSGRCYKSVWNALRRVFGSKIDSTSVPSQSAFQFADWMDRNPAMGLRVFSLKKFEVTGNDIPRGSVIVYRPGQCGAHATHGHIEIAVGNGKACSEFCAPIRACNSRVYVPVQQDVGGLKSVAIDTPRDQNSSDADSNENSKDSMFSEDKSLGGTTPSVIEGASNHASDHTPSTGKSSATTSPEIKSTTEVSKPQIQNSLSENYKVVKFYQSVQN